MTPAKCPGGAVPTTRCFHFKVSPAKCPGGAMQTTRCFHFCVVAKVAQGYAQHDITVLAKLDGWDPTAWGGT